MLREAHRLLDAVAKERNGRDSLAVAVLKPSGTYCEWVSAWTRPRPEGGTCAVDRLRDLVRQLDVGGSEPGLSGALVYRLRDLLARLCAWERWRPGSWGSLPEGIDPGMLRAFLHAEILHSLSVRAEEGATARAEALTASVWDLLLPVRGAHPSAPVTQIGVDALLLARFLADCDERELGL